MRPDHDVVRICRDLVRIDTSNYGADDDRTRGEREAAEYVADLLGGSGVHADLLESRPGRSNVVARVPGTDPARAPFLVHAHLDVVPAVAADWTVPPFAGEIRDGHLWGRGTVDMKGMAAMMLATVAQWSRHGHVPARDLVLAFTADEESTADLGSRFLVRHHAERFRGCRAAITEFGGFRFGLGDGRHVYPIGTAERGHGWLRVTATGAAGHASMPKDGQAVTKLVAALARLGAHAFPPIWSATTRATAARTLREPALDGLPPGARDLLEPVLRPTATPTVLRAGEVVNVVPGEASALVDVRVPPGAGDVVATVREVLGDNVTVEVLDWQPPLETDPGPEYEAMARSLEAEDPAAVPVPFLLSGGTDAQAFAELGIGSYGFTPMWLPDNFDLLAQFHATDEHLPLDALHFGTRVLSRFLSTV